MRTIITLKPTADGKTTVTREKLFDKFKQRNGRRVRDEEAAEAGDAVVSEVRGENQKPVEEGKWGVTYGPNGQKIKVWTPSKKTASESAGSKDLFIGTRGLKLEKEDGRYGDKAHDAPAIRFVSPDEVRVGQMMLMENEGGWGRVQRVMGVKTGSLNAMRIKTDLGERDYLPSAKIQVKTRDSADPRRKIIVHNHLPRAKDAKDADPRDLIAGLTSSAFTKMLNRMAAQMDADSDYHEAVSIAKGLGATPEQADLLARDLGRRP